MEAPVSGPRRRGSLGRRIRVTVLGATAIALLLACGIFLAYQHRTARESLQEEVKTLANVVSIHSILPLASGEAEGAEVTLLALGESPTIEAAAVYSRDGAIFAQFLRDYDHGAPIPASPGAARQAFHGSTLEVVAEIHSGGERVGSVYLRASTAVLATRALHHLMLGAGIFALASIPGLLASERLRRRIATPLAAMAETAENVARGDLTLRFDGTESDGEIALLAAAFQRMTLHLSELVREVRAGIRAVVAATGAIEATSQRTAEQATRQESSLAATAEAIEAAFVSLESLAPSVDQLFDGVSTAARSTSAMEASITTVSERMDHLAVTIDSTSAAAVQSTMAVAQISHSLVGLDSQAESNLALLEELRGSLTSVLGGAEQSQRLSQSACDAANHGREAVENTIIAMSEIESDFADLRRIAISLEENSAAIGSILSLSEEVADETRLLALNAAIIAAQAGEQGRAFAVVAEKVRELASGAANSSREIAIAVERVQASTRAAVVAVEAASGKVERGVALSNDAGAILGRIARGSEESSTTVASIAADVAGQIRELERVRGVAQEARAGVARIQSAVDEHRRASAAIAQAMEQARELGLGVKHSTQEQTHEGHRIAEVAGEIEALTRHVRDATDVQRKTAEETLEALGVFRNTAELATQEGATLHGLVEMLAARSAGLAQQIDRFHFEDAPESPVPAPRRGAA
jgi:methyl-accepting chemotaxis protein